MVGRDELSTTDTLLDGRVTLSQPTLGYRVAIDPVLLAAAVPVKRGQRVLELGVGCGAAALCLIARVPGCTLDGLELDADRAALAARNAYANGFQRQIDVYVGDIVAPHASLTGDYDHVLANPPYMTLDRAPPSCRRDASRVEVRGSLDDWIQCAAKQVRAKGTVTFIHRADRVDDLLQAMNGIFGGLVIYPLWPRAGRAAKRVLVQGRRDVATPSRIAPGLVLHQDGGEYTSAARAVLRDAQALVL